MAIVENACLLHDLGNPPFGHFGETAIKKWWKENYKKYIDDYNTRASIVSAKNISFSTKEEKDFLKVEKQFNEAMVSVELQAEHMENFMEETQSAFSTNAMGSAEENSEIENLISNEAASDNITESMIEKELEELKKRMM